MISCTRRLEWDAAHRVLRHESKCAHLHGHRYVAEIECRGELDPVGRVIDFGAVKALVGAWIDEHWDHSTMVNPEDARLLGWLRRNEQKHWSMLSGEPTAEEIAAELFTIAEGLLKGLATVATVKVWETPNCWAWVSSGKRERSS